MKINKLSYSNLIFAGISLSTGFILIYNIFYFNPILGYDAEAHYDYINYLSRYLPRDFKLPTHNETREFFNPPLGYIVPSISQVFCRNLIESSDFLNDCQPYFGKVTQIFQSLLYVATIIINLYTLKSFNNSKNIFNVGYLILVSLLAVNYRTISMVRGEPYILFFLSLFLFIINKHEIHKFDFNYRSIFFTALIIGGIALSRQWGFLLFLPLIILLFSKQLNIKYLKLWSLSAFIGALFSSWFYINLFIKYGTFTPFNLKSPGFSFSNQKLAFYIPNYEHLKYLFTKPIRPHLDNQFFSILYSDLWGDYWGYFTFTSRFLDIGRDQLIIGDYFARVNIISIFTTFIIIIFCYLTYKTYKSRFLIQYINLAIICSFFGYLIFAISYPDWTGDSIKATYIIQMFHLAVFLSSIYFQKLEEINKNLYNGILSILVLIYIHNFQTYLSHFPINYYP
tara:strand:+ start:777 stop:2135 length:1359 start_codon:yes stop_codon:yes gene_type:complete